MAQYNTIPSLYRIFFLVIEPISTIVGAICAAFRPDAYLALISRSPVHSYENIAVENRVVLLQLANLYLLFAIIEALTLRATLDLAVWRTLLIGLLIADFGHLFSVSPLGSQVYYDIWNWNAMDWGSVAFVYVGASMRLAFLFEIGLSKPQILQRSKAKQG